jgi:hypothetical protein
MSMAASGSSDMVQRQGKGKVCYSGGKKCEGGGANWNDGAPRQVPPAP